MPKPGDAQQRAYNHLLTPESRIKLLSGLPGTGKSTVLEPCVKAWKEAGYRIIGAAIAGKAARNLQQKSGMDSHTVERLKMDLDATFLDKLDHHLVQLNRWTSGLPTYELNRLKLDSRTILVVDEAGMLDTQNAANLLRHVKESGATLVLAGDREQLLPVGAGAPYAVIEERIEPAELELIRRQRLSKDVEAILSFREGKVREVFDDFKTRGLLHVDQNRNESLKRVVHDWARLGGVTNPEKHLIMVQTNESRVEANKDCRQERLLRGTVEAGGITFGEDTISKGDQIIFLRNSNMEPVARPPLVDKSERVKVRNGDLATVVSIGGPPFAQTVVAQLHEGGEKVRFAISDYRDIALGYAVTVHKFQGSDVANALWLAETKNLSKELGYTAITRHVQSLHVYANELDAGKKLEHLERKLRTSAREPLGYELFQRHVAEMRKNSDDLELLPPRPTLLEDEPMLSHCRNRAFLSLNGKTRDWAAEFVGKRKDLELHESVGSGNDPLRPQNNRSLQWHEQYAIMPSEFYTQVMSYDRQNPQNNFPLKGVFHSDPGFGTVPDEELPSDELIERMLREVPHVESFLPRTADAQELPPWSDEDRARLELPIASASPQPQPAPKRQKTPFERFENFRVDD